MAAPMLTKAQTNTSLRAKTSKKQKKTKSVLKNTFELVWPKLDVDIEERILQKLKSTIEPLGIAKIQCNRNSQRQSDDAAVKKSADDGEKKINKEVRNQLLIGVNQVTKGLEKDIVRLVLTCPSAQPPILTQHLIGLSAARQCPAINIAGLSPLLSSLMNLKSAIAVAFKKCPDGTDSVFDEVVNYICQYAPTPQLPWIPTNISVESGDVGGKRDTQKQIPSGECAVSAQDDALEKNISNDNKLQSVQDSKKAVTQADEKKAHDLGSAANHKPDYSCFYVYKNTAKDDAKSNIPGNKISNVETSVPQVGSGNDEAMVKSNEDQVGSSTEEKKKKGKKRKLSKTMSFVDFQSANILSVPPNENRRERTKNKKEKKIRKKKKLKKIENILN